MSFEAEGGNVEIETPPAAAAAQPEAEATPAPLGAEQLAQMNAMVAQFGEFVERAEAARQPLAEENEPPPAAEPTLSDEAAWHELTKDLPAEAFTEDGSLTARGLQTLMRREAQKTAQELLGARDAQETERSAAERRTRELDALEERFPFMQDQETADKVVDAAEIRAKQLGAVAGVDYRLLLREPRFIVEQIALMFPDGGAAAASPTSEVPIELPGAAGAGGASAEMDEADRIVAAGARGRHSVGAG